MYFLFHTIYGRIIFTNFFYEQCFRIMIEIWFFIKCVTQKHLRALLIDWVVHKYFLLFCIEIG